MKLDIIDFEKDTVEVSIDVNSFETALKLIKLIGHPGVKYRYIIKKDGVEYEAFGCAPYGPDEMDVTFEYLNEVPYNGYL